MNFTGINTRSIPSYSAASLSVNNFEVSDGEIYSSLCEPKKIEFGFSGNSNSVGFTLKSGKIFDPENRIVYGYTTGIPFSMEFHFDQTSYEYYFNDSLICATGNKPSFDLENFYFNCNGLTAAVDFTINGNQIDYSTSFPEVYSGNYLTGYLINNSAYKVKIFSGEILSSPQDSFITTGITGLFVNSNSSGQIVLEDFYKIDGAKTNALLMLYTNFGNIGVNITSTRL